MTPDSIPPSPLGDRPESATPTQNDVPLPSASTLIYVNPDARNRRGWLSRVRHRRDADVDDVALINMRSVTDPERH